MWLSRPELAIRKGIRQQLLQLVKNHSHIVTLSRRLEVSPDPDDNMFLECAVTARADYLITGDQRHFPRDGYLFDSPNPNPLWTADP
jgi:putative PIN family toxin of toxin-antitoxin system